jgi:hypothetical protein
VVTNAEWYFEVPSLWARETCVSTHDVVYPLLVMTGKKKKTVFDSNSADNAERLFLPAGGT